MASKYSYSNIGSSTVSGRKYQRGTIGNAEFKNAKSAYPAKGKTTRSSSTPAAGSKGAWSYNNMSTHSEVARQRRQGKNVAFSGPKSRKK
jgi:hypothetical protein